MKHNAYLKTLKHDVDRWVGKGLIGDRTGNDLIAEAADFHAANTPSNPVLPGLAGLAILLGLLTIIGANWAGMTGYARLGLTFGMFGVILFLAGDLRARGIGLWSDLAATIGAALFGGAMVVIGQLYHSSATTSEFLSVWALGATLISLLLASPRAGALAAALGVGWTLYHFSELDWRNAAFHFGPFWVLPMGAALAWRAVASKAIGIVHVLIIGAAIWITPPML